MDEMMRYLYYLVGSSRGIESVLHHNTMLLKVLLLYVWLLLLLDVLLLLEHSVRLSSHGGRSQ